MEKLTTFDDVYKLNVKDKTETKNGLSYLSWAWAWAEFKKLYPEANYAIKKFGDNNLPFICDEATGYMVFTEVTANGITHEMWLPVMDGANKSMKNVPYTYKTKFGEKGVEAATMFDVNKTIMRCLTKNLAMFGLGLYIYAGEDLPEGEEVKTVSTVAQTTANDAWKAKLNACQSLGGLQTVWATIPATTKLNKELQALKEQLKAKLSEAK